MYAEIKATLQEEEVVQSAETPQTVHTQRRSLFFYCILVAGFPSEGCYRKLPPGVRSAKECFFFSLPPLPPSLPPSPPLLLMPPPQLFVCLLASERRHTRRTTCDYEYWFPLGKKKKKSGCSHSPPGMTPQFPSLSDHNTTLCSYVAPGVTSQGHGLPRFPRPLPYDAVAPSLRRHDQGSAALHVPSQPHNRRLPIYTRLLMATLINFTGRQSNTALPWRRGGAGRTSRCLVYPSNFFFFFFLASRRTLSRQATTLALGGRKEGEMKGKEMRVSLRCAQKIDRKTGEEEDVGGERASDRGRADIKEAFVEASPSHRARIRAGERRTLRTLRGGIECLRCRTLSSRLSALNFFSFFFFFYH